MKKTYEELEKEAEEITVNIQKLDNLFEEEEDEVKLAKLESKLDRAEARREKLYERMDGITDKEAKPENEGKEVKNETGDTDVCPECGGDLYDEGDGVLYCEHCKEYFEEGEE